MAILRSTQVTGSVAISQDLTVTGSIHGTVDKALVADKADALDASKDYAVKGLTVGGDLTVNGNVTYVGATNLQVKDKNIELNVANGKAGSTLAAADGAGITVKTTDGAFGAVESVGNDANDAVIYLDATTKSWKSNIPFDVTVKGTSENAKEAEHAKSADSATTATTADKTKASLTAGTGIKSFTFNGSAAATVAVDDAHIQSVAKAVKVDSAAAADSATNAATAAKVANALTIDTTSDSELSFSSTAKSFNGSAAATLKLDLSGIKKDISDSKDAISTLQSEKSSYATKADITASNSRIASIEAKTGSYDGYAAKIEANTTAASNAQKTADSKIASVEGSGVISVVTDAETHKATVSLKTANDGNVKFGTNTAGALTASVSIPAATVTGVASGDKILSLTDKNLSATLKINYAEKGTTKGLTAKPVVQLLGIGDDVISEIDATNFIKDGMLQSAELITNEKGGKTIHFVFNTDAGSKTIDVDVTDLVDTYTGGTGIVITNNVVSIADTVATKTFANTAASVSASAVKAAIDKYTVNGQSQSEGEWTVDGAHVTVGGTGADSGSTVAKAIQDIRTLAQGAVDKAGVTSFGGKTGAISIPASSSSNGTINFTVNAAGTMSAAMAGIDASAFHAEGYYATPGNVDTKIAAVASEASNTAANAGAAASSQIRVTVSQSAAKVSAVTVNAPTFATAAELTATNNAVTSASSVANAAKAQSDTNKADIATLKAATGSYIDTSATAQTKVGDLTVKTMKSNTSVISSGSKTVTLRVDATSGDLEFVFA